MPFINQRDLHPSSHICQQSYVRLHLIYSGQSLLSTSHSLAQCILLHQGKVGVKENVALRWLPTIPENVKLLRTHSLVTKFILNTPKTGQCGEYFQEKHEGHCCTYNEK